MYNINCVRFITFFDETYNNLTLFILQYFSPYLNDFLLEIWYNTIPRRKEMCLWQNNINNMMKILKRQ